MTKARSLRAFFKKFFNLDSTGMSVSAVLDEITQNNETFPGGGGGGGLFVATYTNNNDTWECDKTLAEILAAIEAGKSVWAYDGEEDFYCALNTFYPGEDGNVEFGYIHFSLYQGNVILMYSKLMHTSDLISVTYGSGSFHAET